MDDWAMGIWRDEQSVTENLWVMSTDIGSKKERATDFPWNNEISYITNTVDLPNVQTTQNVQGNLLLDVAVRS